MPIEPVSEITPAHYVQYRPLPNLYEFGLDYINMTEAGKNVYVYVYSNSKALILE